MNRQTVMRIAAVVYFLYGIPFFLAPNVVGALYNAPAMNGPGIYNSSLFGAALIAGGVATWRASTASAEAARITIMATLLSNGLSLLVALYHQLNMPGIPAMGWMNVVILAVFTGAFFMLYRADGAGPAAQAA